MSNDFVNRYEWHLEVKRRNGKPYKYLASAYSGSVRKGLTVEIDKNNAGKFNLLRTLENALNYVEHV